ncbi:hypothetical protein R1flu_010915 [Riccia fluitans]|uniref:LAGLIDADG homing endonuclease n=1 Tax=Riccia fluitans TaxID=41844 RepID=A0ABD1Z6G1_9MARC
MRWWRLGLYNDSEYKATVEEVIVKSLETFLSQGFYAGKKKRKVLAKACHIICRGGMGVSSRFRTRVKNRLEE